MANEEMEKRMEFLLKQQESFADSQREIYQMLHDLAERQDKTQAQVDKTQAQVEETQKQVKQTNEAVFGLVSIVGSLVESQKATDERATGLSERLDIFINMLERYISEGRNGKNPNPS